MTRQAFEKIAAGLTETAAVLRGDKKPAGQWEMYEGKMQRVLNPDRVGWWRFHDHYDRDGYCDSPGRGY